MPDLTTISFVGWNRVGYPRYDETPTQRPLAQEANNEERHKDDDEWMGGDETGKGHMTSDTVIFRIHPAAHLVKVEGSLDPSSYQVRVNTGRSPIVGSLLLQKQ